MIVKDEELKNDELPINKIVLGDCINVMKKFPSNSIDIVICDPPYALGFMGKEWDTFDKSQFGIAGNEGENDLKVKKNFNILPRLENWSGYYEFSYNWAKEALRIAKPGATLMAFGGCYDDKTEILTENGWKLFKDVSKNERVATLNPETEEIEYQYPLEIVEYDGFKKLYHFKTNKIDLMVTPNHKMFVKYMGGYKNAKWKLIRADELKSAIKMKKNGVWKGQYQEYFVLPKTKQSNGHYMFEIPEKKIPMNIWLKFFGLWLAEGSASIVKLKDGFSYETQICHFDNKNLDELEKELSSYFNICRYPKSGKMIINNKQLTEYLKQFGYSWQKFIPKEIKMLCPEQLSILLEWYMRGDSDGRRCYTCSKALVDDLQEIALKIGISADYMICKKKEGNIKGRKINQKHTQYVISINRTQNEPEVYQKHKKIKVKDVVDYNGKVYCVEVSKYHTLYVRRNGKTVWCGNTRTWHRLACAIEDAGWIIKDTIMWLYGCVSEDTEILTTNGWKKWNEIKNGEEIFNLNLKTGLIEKDKVLEKFVYDIDEEVVNLKNDDTDQLITKNHKVILKRYTREQKNLIRKWEKPENWQWDFVINLDNYTPIDLPLAGIYDGDLSIGVDFAFLLGWILSEGHFYKQNDRKNTNDIRIYQSSIILDKVNLIRETLDRLGIKYGEYNRQRKYKDREYTEFCFVISDKEWKEKIYQLIPNKKPTWQLLNLKYEEKLALFNALILGDGNLKQKQFYQYDKDFLEWFQVLCHLIGKQARINMNKWSVAIHDKPATQLQCKHLKDRFMRYGGKVWSIRTNNMTYIARRNGKIFITGNSGFPKATDISKQIDKKLGAEREVVGKDRSGKTAMMGGLAGGEERGGEFNLTAPPTPEAKLWEGYKCVSEDTEILTINGWRKIGEIKEGDEVFGFDLLTEKILKTKVKNVFVYDYNDEMINIKNKHTDQLITPNHRVICKKHNRPSENGKRISFYDKNWRYIEAKGIKTAQLQIPVAGYYDGEFSIGEDLAELIGWVLSEGSFRKTGKGILIAQSSVNSKKVSRIKNLIKKIGISYKERIYSQKYKDKEFKMHYFYLSARDPITLKIRELIPDKKPMSLLWYLSLKEKERLYDGLILGDGFRNKECEQLSQKDKDFLEWFQVFCAFLGRAVKINLYRNRATIKKGHCANYIGIRMYDVKKTKYVGRVWSIETETGNYIARRNEKIFITGNSHGLKPAYEPIILAMKPNDGSYAENALKYSVSGLAIKNATIGNTWNNDEIRRKIEEQLKLRYNIGEILWK